MRRTLDWVVLVLVLGGAGYVAYTHPAQVRTLVHLAEGKVAPCTRPVTYSIGFVDSRFGISKSILVKDLQEAETIWEKPSTKNLFEYTEVGGDVTINLIYDNRQAATDKLEAAGIQIDQSKASYDGLKVRYDTLLARVKLEQAEYANLVIAYKNHEEQYNTKVEQWNQRGGAPKAEYDQLQVEKSALAQEFERLKTLEGTMNADVDTLNALATTLNQLIVQLNLNVTQYNRVGASAGEFEEGLYQRSGGVQTIDVYEYSNHVQLVRVLAHELGHALSLEHVLDPKAIMYKLNSSKGLAATEADLSELTRVCTLRN